MYIRVSLTRTKNLRQLVRIFFFLVSVLRYCLRQDYTIATLSRVGLTSKKMTAHFVPYLEGCSLASTIIGTALRELMFYVRVSRHDCELLVHFSLDRSREWTEYFCVRRTSICLCTSRGPLPCVMWLIVTHELTGLSKCASATLLTLVCGVVRLRTVTAHHLTYLQATGGSGNGG